jgi:hypothetical protein
MTRADSNENNGADMAKEHTQATAEPSIPFSDKRSPDSKPVPKKQHLDVDEVLERSVRKVVSG